MYSCCKYCGINSIKQNLCNVIIALGKWNNNNCTANKLFLNPPFKTLPNVSCWVQDDFVSCLVQLALLSTCLVSLLLKTKLVFQLFVLVDLHISLLLICAHFWKSKLLPLTLLDKNWHGDKNKIFAVHFVSEWFPFQRI